MKRSFVIVWLFLAGCTAHTLPQMTEQETHALIGTWRGLRFETWDAQGRAATPFGDPISAYVVFDATGHAFVQMMKVPPVAPSASAEDATPEALRAALDAFIGYYGPYLIDEEKKTFTIHVEGSNLPTYVGSRQVRHFRIEGDTLTMGTPGAYQATLVRVR